MDEYVAERGGLQSIDRILFRDFFSTSFAFPLMMKSFKRLTSDSFTGFNRNSSAPSSIHLSCRNNQLLRNMPINKYWLQIHVSKNTLVTKTSMH